MQVLPARDAALPVSTRWNARAARVIYARAKPLVTKAAPPVVASASPAAEPQADFFPTFGEEADQQLELTIRIWAIPVALVLAKLVMMSPALSSLSRVFLSMWIHELGHAVRVRESSRRSCRPHPR